MKSCATGPNMRDLGLFRIEGVDVDDLMLDGQHTEELMCQFMDLVASLAPIYKAFADAADHLLANKAPEPKPAPVKKSTGTVNVDNKDDFDALMRVFLDSIGAD